MDGVWVVKVGGRLCEERDSQERLARALADLAHPAVLVHGGGDAVTRLQASLGCEPRFVEGRRVTGADDVAVVEMVLSGSINKGIVRAIQEVGGKAIGLSGKDGNLIQARRLQRTKRDPDSNIERVLDLGFVGEPDRIDTEVLEAFKHTEFIPVIAPIGVGRDGATDRVVYGLGAALGVREFDERTSERREGARVGGHRATVTWGRPPRMRPPLGRTVAGRATDPPSCLTPRRTSPDRSPPVPRTRAGAPRRPR